MDAVQSLSESIGKMEVVACRLGWQWCLEWLVGEGIIDAEDYEEARVNRDMIIDHRFKRIPRDEEARRDAVRESDTRTADEIGWEDRDGG